MADDDPEFEYLAQVVELPAGQAVALTAPNGWESEPQGWLAVDAIVQLGALEGAKRARVPGLCVMWRRRKERR